MGFTLDKIVPWGRSFDEYVAMFNLSGSDLKLRLLGCGDGPAGFNSELTRRGGRVVSIDPIYGFNADQIKTRIAETYDTVMTQMRNNQNSYAWKSISSVEALGELRLAAMNVFLADFEEGKQAGRYLAGELPLLALADNAFDIALSSHLLLLYSAHLSLEFHLRALQDMLRVAGEARVFPLLTLDGSRSPYLDPIVKHFAGLDCPVEITRVDYEFQRGGNEMLRIRRPPSNRTIKTKLQH